MGFRLVMLASTCLFQLLFTIVCFGVVSFAFACYDRLRVRFDCARLFLEVCSNML